MKLRTAAHLCGWPREIVSDRRRVMEIVQDAGYDGVEGFGAGSPDELVELAALAAEYGLRLVNVGCGDVRMKARLNATLGNGAAEVQNARKKDGRDPTDAELDELAGPLEEQIATFGKYGVRPFHHIHLGCLLETTEDCDRVLKRLPGLWLLFDTGHLLAANSNPMDVLHRWPKRIAHVHLKNFWTQDPQAGWDAHQPDFWKTSRFCDLAEGNTGLDVKGVLDGLVKAGYDGWVSIEEDHPRRDVADVWRDNRDFLRQIGY